MRNTRACAQMGRGTLETIPQVEIWRQVARGRISTDVAKGVAGDARAAGRFESTYQISDNSV